MATVIRNKKALAERPLKTSQATGASLATMGIMNSIPLMHGSQGCGAFAKVYLIQHFREPMPIQNTAIDHISAVMGGDESVQAALKLLCEKQNPDAITLMTTGLTEVQGTDIERNVRDFRLNHPEYNHIEIISVPTPDFVGSLQSGFALTIDSYIKQILGKLPESMYEKSKQKNGKQVNVLCAAALSPADIEQLKLYFTLFGLEGIFVPDLSLSLDGHLNNDTYNATSTGGCSIDDIKAMPDSCATIVIGESLINTGQWLTDKFETPSYALPHCMGMAATDELFMLLQKISGKPVPFSMLRARQRLQDTLLDIHFVVSTAKVAMALESDFLIGFEAVLSEAGCTLPLAVSASQSLALKDTSIEKIVIGDHSDLDKIINSVDLVVGNTHCAEFFEHLLPVFRAGFPCHDRFGNSDKLVIGYEGARNVLNEIANLILANHDHSVPAYQSPYRFSAEQVSVIG